MPHRLQVCLMVPWGLQLLFYCFLYHAFPRDRDSSIELSRQQRVQPSSSQTGILDAAGMLHVMYLYSVDSNLMICSHSFCALHMKDILEVRHG